MYKLTQRLIRILESDNPEDSKLTDDELSQVYEFINTFQDSYNKPLNIKIAESLLRYAKTWYEYMEYSPISDEYYDKLLATYRLVGHEPNPIAIGNDTEIKHPTLHNNLDKAYRIYDSEPIPDGTAEKTSIESWLSKCYKSLELSKDDMIQLNLTPKLDGVSVIADIRKGVIISGQSRGDESKAMVMPGLSGLNVGDPELDDYDPFTIQYEMYCTHEQRDALSELMGTQYKSNRSAIAGFRKRLETIRVENLEKYISLYPINGVVGDGMCYAEIVDWITNFALNPNDMVDTVTICGTFDDLLISIKKAFEDAEKIRPKLSFPIDGIVISVVNDRYQKIIGRERRTNKFQMALKFNPAYEDVRISGVTLSAGDKGYRTIMVQLKHPVFIDGAEYTEVQVLSARQFIELGLHDKSKVRIHRTGDVIPKITKLDDKGELLELPKNCPTCGHKLIMDKQKLKCVNPDCVENLAGRLRFMFASLDLEGYSSAFADKLVSVGYNNPCELFNITTDDLISKGITGKIPEAFPEVLKAKLKSVSDHDMLSAIGLPGIGKESAKRICQMYTLDKLSNSSYNELCEMLKIIKGIKMYKDLAQALHNAKDELKILSRLNLSSTTGKKSSLVIGQTKYRIGDKYDSILKSLNYSVTESTSFDILVVGDKNSSSSKIEKAIKKDIPILDPIEFKSWLYTQRFKHSIKVIKSDYESAIK